MKTITDTLRARLERQTELIGEEKTLRLINSSVCIIGLGGVGGYVTEMLARAGVGRLFLADCDIVSVSNLNRQIIALTDTIGMKKTDVMLDRVLRINPECQASALDIFVTKENAESLISESGCDIIIDCIDNVSAKTAIIAAAKQQGKYVFSAMGAGNKSNLSDYRITDIKNTHTCGLARAVRKNLKELGIDGVDVIFSTETPVAIGKRSPASICYMPSGAGLMIAEHIIKLITQ